MLFESLCPIVANGRSITKAKRSMPFYVSTEFST